MKSYIKHFKTSVMNKAITAVLLTVLIWGCSDFGSMNEDPNNPRKPVRNCC